MLPSGSTGALKTTSRSGAMTPARYGACSLERAYSSRAVRRAYRSWRCAGPWIAWIAAGSAAVVPAFGADPAPSVAVPLAASPSSTDPTAQLTEAVRLFNEGRYEEATPFAQRALTLAEGTLRRTTRGLRIARPRWRSSIGPPAGWTRPRRCSSVLSQSVRKHSARRQHRPAVSLQQPRRALPGERRRPPRQNPCSSVRLRSAKRCLVPKAPPVATTLTNLGSALDDLGRPARRRCHFISARWPFARRPSGRTIRRPRRRSTTSLRRPVSLAAIRRHCGCTSAPSRSAKRPLDQIIPTPR